MPLLWTSQGYDASKSAIICGVGITGILPFIFFPLGARDGSVIKVRTGVWVPQDPCNSWMDHDGPSGISPSEGRDPQGKLGSKTIWDSSGFD